MNTDKPEVYRTELDKYKLEVYRTELDKAYSDIIIHELRIEWAKELYNSRANKEKLKRLGKKEQQLRDDQIATSKAAIRDLEILVNLLLHKIDSLNDRS